MNPDENPMDIKYHGVTIDKKRQRVKCNYCSKEMSGSYRLKCHLGGIRGDVKSCKAENLPDNVKDYMRKLVSDKKPNIVKKTEKPHSSSNPWSMIRTPPPNTGNLNPGMTRNRPSINLGSTSSDQLNKEIVIFSEVKRGSSTQEAKLSVGRFFYETGTSINAPNLSSCKRMVTSINSQPHLVGGFPTYEELQGWIFMNHLHQMHEYVDDIKRSWAETGCTILIESWTDGEGQKFMLALADCPKGPIYLRSYALSSGDDCNVQKPIDKLVKKIGEKNVFQILVDGFEPSCTLGIDKSKYRGIFRSPSASYCLVIILKRMAESPIIKVALKHAKVILKFIYQRTTTEVTDKLKGCCLLSTLRNEIVNQFLTLKNMSDNKDYLIAKIKSSKLQSSIEDRSYEQANFLAKGSDFWDDVKMAIEVASPLMDILSTLNFSTKPQLSYVYEAMDQAKEKIKTNLEQLDQIDEEEKQYQCQYFWDMIDDVWNNHMYTPLHAAAHLFNPTYDRSKIDREIQSGFEETIRCMVQDESTQNQIFQQVYSRYQNSSCCFYNGHETAGEENLSPAEWWYIHGDQFPQLAKFATKVVSQTCAGASRYGLDKRMAEDEVKSRSEKSAEGGLENNTAVKVHASSSNKNVYQQRMIDKAFIYYNLQMQNFKAYGGLVVGEAEDVDPTRDWVFKDE